MEKEFNLSEKIFWIDKGYSRGGRRDKKDRTHRTKPGYKNQPRIKVKDVKEFIEILIQRRREMTGWKDKDDPVIKLIKELAGPKLI